MKNFFTALLDCVKTAMELRAELYIKTKGWE